MRRTLLPRSLRKTHPAVFVVSLLLILSAMAASLPASAQRATQADQRGMKVRAAEPLKELPSGSKRWALVIGVDSYRDAQISPLKGAANDARLLADALVRYAGFPADQVILMTTAQPEERQPTRVNILRRLSNLAAVIPKDGLLLVSFAGHGMERGGQAYLLPSDAQISDDVTFLEETAVSVSRMRERIKTTGVGQVLILLDACRNDPGGRADAPNNLTEGFTRGFNFDVRNREVQAFATVYATAVGQRAYEYTEKRQGYFTWALVEGLKGGAADEKGEVTLARLIDYVQTTVPKRIGIDLGAGKQQRPFAVVEGYKADNLVIAVAGGGAAPAAPAPAPATDPAALELSFWDSVKNSSDPADFKAYLDKYPEGQFADLARRRAQPAAAPAPGAVNPAALPTDEQVIEAYIKARGGKSAIEGLQTLAVKGIVEVSVAGKTYAGKVEGYFKAPDKTLQISDVPRLFKEEAGFDGTVGWRKDGRGVKVMNDWQQAFTRRNQIMSYLTDISQFRAVYPRAVVKGRENVGGREAYVVEVEPVGAKPETLYFDTETGLLIRMDVMFESGDSQQGVGIPMQLYADEYASVNGVKIPAVFRQVGSGMTLVTRYFDIKYNVPIDDRKFAKPAR